MSTYINWSIAIILATLMLTAGGCTTTEQETVVTDTDHSGEIILNDEQIKNAGVTLGSIQRQPVSLYVTCTGALKVPPTNLVSVHSPVHGFIKPRYILEGQRVEKGQVLATVSHPDIINVQQEYMESVGKLKYAESDYKRKQELVASDATSGKQFEQAESDYLAMKAKVLGLKEKLKLMGLDPDRVADGNLSSAINITSPIDGYIAKVLVNNGKAIEQNDEIAELVDDSHLHVEAFVYSNDVPRVKEGQLMAVTIPGSDSVFYAEVSLVGKMLNEENNTVNIHGHLIKEYEGLVPGTFLEVSIRTAHDTVDAVPRGAVVTAGNQHYVFVKGAQGFIRVPFVAGNEDEDYVEVKTLDGLPNNAQLVLSGAYYINGSMEE